jgi:hypothetical protein
VGTFRALSWEVEASVLGKIKKKWHGKLMQGKTKQSFRPLRSLSRSIFTVVQSAVSNSAWNSFELARSSLILCLFVCKFVLLLPVCQLCLFAMPAIQQQSAASF